MIDLRPAQKSSPVATISDSDSGLLTNNNFQASARFLAKNTAMIIVSEFVTTPYPYPTVAVSVDIVSTSVNDTLLGSGARKVIVIGLDGSRDSLTEIVEMNGTTPVTLSSAFLRINKLLAFDSLPRSINDGDIVVSTTVGADILSGMVANVGQSFDGVLSTPVNFQTQIFTIDIGSGKGDSGAAAFFRSTEDGPLIQRTADIFFYENNFDREFTGPIVIPAESDVELRARINNNNTQLTATSQLLSTTAASSGQLLGI